MPHKIVDCDQCDREHLAPPPPPEFYSSFAVPLMRSQSYQRQLRQWIRTTTNGEDLLNVKNNGGDPALNIERI